MAKVTADEIKRLGFIREMFGKIVSDENGFTSFVEEVIDEQSSILQGRLGGLYTSLTDPVAAYTKRAEKCLVAAELVQRRINVILGNAVGAGAEISVSHETSQKKAYTDEAERLILKASGDDYSGGVTTSGAPC